MIVDDISKYIYTCIKTIQFYRISRYQKINKDKIKPDYIKLYIRYKICIS